MFLDKNYVLKTDEGGSKAEQFPLDEILDEGERVVRGYASVQIKDSQGEIIPIKGTTGLKRSMNTWMDRGGIITDTHTNRVVGKGLNWAEKVHPKTGKPAIIIDYKIHKDYSIDDQVWDEIKSGKRKGLSFGGRALDEPTIKRDKDSDGVVRELGNFEAYEMASVEDPANKFAENTHVNFLAKSNSDKNVEKLSNDLQKGYVVKDIKKPFAGFSGFDECVSAQEEKGHSEDSGKRICGWLKHRTEKNWMKEKELDPDDVGGDVAFERGMEVESEEHPDLDEESIKNLVMDHLEEDSTYYSKGEKTKQEPDGEHPHNEENPHGNHPL